MLASCRPRESLGTQSLGKWAHGIPHWASQCVGDSRANRHRDANWEPPLHRHTFPSLSGSRHSCPATPRHATSHASSGRAGNKPSSYLGQKVESLHDRDWRMRAASHVQNVLTSYIAQDQVAKSSTFPASYISYTRYSSSQVRCHHESCICIECLKERQQAYEGCPILRQRGHSDQRRRSQTRGWRGAGQD